ncbi:MAG: porin family protein [Acidiferrobacterales bacterium]
MNIRQWLVVGMIGMVSTGATPLTYAQDKGWYVGAGLDRSDDTALDDSDNGFRLFGGYRFNRYVALQGAVVTLGTELGPADFTKDGLAVQAIGTFPVGKRFELFAKAGFFVWEVRVETNEFDCSDFDGGFICFVDEDVVDDGTDPVYGFGVEYRFGERWGVRSEWERFEDVGESDIDSFSTSVTFRF